MKEDVRSSEPKKDVNKVKVILTQEVNIGPILKTTSI